MRVTLRVTTVNSKLARDVGRKAGKVTSAVLVVKLAPWWWPQGVEKSSCTWQAPFTCWCWGGSGYCSVLLTSSALGQQLGLQDALLQAAIARQSGRAVSAAPHVEQATLLMNGLPTLVRPGRVMLFWKALPVQRSCVLLLVFWLSQP